MSKMGFFGFGNTGAGIQTITGNSGGAVPPDGSFNINVVGSGGVLVTGDPSDNTLTITATVTEIVYKNVNTSPYTVLTSDEYLSVDCSGGAIELKFPNAATLSQSFIVKDRTGSSATNNITITTVGGSVDIDGVTSFVMNTNYESVNLMGNGSSYEVF